MPAPVALLFPIRHCTTHQPGGTHPRTITDSDQSHFIQHDKCRRSCIGHADFPRRLIHGTRTFPDCPCSTNSGHDDCANHLGPRVSWAVLTPEYEMNFTLVPDNQPLVPINFFNYPDESDLNGGISPYGLYPIPTNLPIETWPKETGTQTIYQWQTNNDGRRPSCDRGRRQARDSFGRHGKRRWLTPTNWEASNGAMFNLNTNGLRPAGWTSGDAAGFPMFPALVRYDEAERGMVEHACRLVVKKSRYNNYIYPATHYAALCDQHKPESAVHMGQRLRLKAAFIIPANWTKEENAVLLGMKKYGAMVADNGSFFSLLGDAGQSLKPANCF